MLDGPETHTSNQPALGCLVRLFWMGFGNLALILAWLSISESQKVGLADLGYAGLILLLLLARWVDIAKLNGMTVRAEPASRAHLRRYSIGLVSVALIGWAAAQWLSGAY